LADNAD